MNFLFPRFDVRLLPRMLFIALLGGLVGGIYGVAHDLVTFSIAPEYFIRLKFHQFRYADFGFPPAVLAAEVGFIATGAVGFFAGWFLARVAVPAWPFAVAFRRCGAAFGVVIGFAVGAFAVGYGLGCNHSSDYGYWITFCEGLGVEDVPAFARVGIIHGASYVGGLGGLLVAIGMLRRATRRSVGRKGSGDPETRAGLNRLDLR